ncbi:hypothetical protein GcC1_011018 [Golovinomyces cichoracearum]|uniref:Uncharacterized protein n=1 Tax=Golovinomyces cichoracearum TaxID=62708 RepID=A0A420J7H4_9PEZI|nr:hypothetical protein GcC1_011018 [Golovinomyces cichoracearum]
MSNLDTDMKSGEGFNLSNEPILATILYESDSRYNEIKQILVEMQSREIIREEAHQKEMENMRVNMRDLMLAIKGKFADTVDQKIPTASANNGSLISPPQEKENISENLKLKPIKWPETYNHEDQSQWKTTHGVLNYIFQREVIERKFLTSGDYFMTLSAMQ